MKTFISDVLAGGKCTGGILHPTPDGTGQLQVRYGARGRGVFAASSIKRSTYGLGFGGGLFHCYVLTHVADTIVAIGTGHLVDKAPGQYTLTWHGGKEFAFDLPGAANLAVLVNTACTAVTGAANNARYIRGRLGGKPCVKVRVRFLES